MLRMEGELYYSREINILLLLNSQSSKFSEGSFLKKSLPTLILGSPFTEEEKIFFSFCILRVEGEFHYAKKTQSNIRKSLLTLISAS